MCGIIGEFRFDELKIDKREFNRKLNELNHRGPDQKSKIIKGRLAIGHTRLSIIDPYSKNGEQPKESENIILTYNGEIYNFNSISNKLLKSASKSSDTQVLFELIEKYDSVYLNELRGMFAFAWYNKTQNTLNLVRDPFGIKPLYFHKNKNRIVFSSEIKPLIHDKEYHCKVNSDALKEHILLGHSLGQKTLFNDVFCVEPGTHMIVDSAGNIEVKKNLNISDVVKSNNDKNFNSVLENSLKLHKISDVPVGLMLSGGVDSNLIFKKLNEIETTNNSFELFTAGDVNSKNEGDNDELKIALKISHNSNLTHNIIPIEFKNFISIRDLVYKLEEPVCNPSGFLIDLISKSAKEKGIKVLLTGHGADEAYGGYRRYLVIKYLNYLKPLAWLLRIIQVKIKSNSLFRIYRAVSNSDHANFEVASIGSQALHQQQLFNDNLFNNNDLDRIANEYMEKIPPNSYLSKLKSSMLADTINYLGKQNLINADKVSMSNSIEIRVPFVDKEMFSYGFNLNETQLIDFGKGKVHLRDYLKNKFNFIPKKSKTGFGPNLMSIIRSSECEELLLGEKTKIRGIFNQINLKNKLNQQVISPADIMQLLNMAFIEQWFRVFIDTE